MHQFLLVVKVFFVSLLKQRKKYVKKASKGRDNDNNKPARSDHERYSSSTAKYRIHHGQIID
ncbi:MULTISPECIES: hypothetical protein [unclassified Acinetobacter]|uniref:hypothetical protein n=1 Tax=unclassified Acinetobacter TaxID=196816 RepID=UPI001408F278|nr:MULTISPECIES: hypothetical protein [unclassified Acinetobacter]